MSDDALSPTADLPELHIPGGLLGFPELERYTLVEWGGDGSPFSMLRSVDEPDLATFVVVPPHVFFPDYVPEIADEAVSDLGIETEDDALLLSIVTVKDPVQSSTLNLLGPIVVNIHKRVGAQTVLDPERYSCTQPITG